MNSISNFLWKLFSVMMVFLYSTSVVPCFADDDPLQICAEEDKVDETNDVKHTLCQTGYYVYSCGNYNTGTYWLKSSDTLTTNYYDTTNNLVNLHNLHILFNGTPNEKIEYIADSTSDTSTIVDYNGYVESRKKILANFCNVLDGSMNVTCAPCPNGGTVASSFVYITKENDKIRCGSYSFHTIADCHIDTFEDSTGEYRYMIPNGTESQFDALACYYANSNANITGTVLNKKTSQASSSYLIITDINSLGTATSVSDIFLPASVSGSGSTGSGTFIPAYAENP